MKLLLLTLTIVIAAAGPLAAQDQRAQAPPPAGQLPPPGPGPNPPGITDNMTPGEIQRLFDAYLIMEAQQFLSLNDQQYAPFLTRLRLLQETRRKSLQQRMQLMNELQRMSNPRATANVSEAQLKERLTALQDLEARAAVDMHKAYAALDEVLDVRQQARFRVFEEQIERRKIELLMRARQQNRPNQQQLKRPPG